MWSNFSPSLVMNTPRGYRVFFSFSFHFFGHRDTGIVYVLLHFGFGGSILFIIIKCLYVVHFVEWDEKTSHCTSLKHFQLSQDS